MVVQRGVALGAGFQLIKEVVNNLAQGQGVVQFHPVGAQVLHILHGAAPILAQFHNRTDKVRGRQDSCGHHRLAYLLDLSFGELRRVHDVSFRAVFRHHHVFHVRGGRNQHQIKLAFQTLANNLEVQQTQETATETRPQGGR